MRIGRSKRIYGLGLGPTAAGFLYLTPLPALTPAAHALAAILACVVLYWLLEPIPLPITALMLPIALAMAQSAGVSPIPPALGACLGASLGFVLPVSTPPNAIVYGTGLVPTISMLRAGLLFDLLGGVIIWITLRLLCPVIGLT